MNKLNKKIYMKSLFQKKIYKNINNILKKHF